MGFPMYQILKKQKIGENIYEMQIEAPHIVKYAEPGNFIILYSIDTIHKQSLSLGAVKWGRLVKKAGLFYGQYAFNFLGLLRRGHNQCFAGDNSLTFLISERGFQANTVFCIDDFQNLQA